MAFEKLNLRARPAQIVAPIRSGVVAKIKPHKDAKRQTTIELKINVDVMESMRLMIGDRLEAYFNADTNQLGFKRHPNGEVVVRPWASGKLDYTGQSNLTGRITLTGVPNLVNIGRAQHSCTYLVNPDHPSCLFVTLPDSFFEQLTGVWAELQAA